MRHPGFGEPTQTGGAMDGQAVTVASPGATGRALFDLRQVGVRLGSVNALTGVDLHMVHGERVALVGANGCGKSTMLRLLNGLLQPAGGRIVRDAAARQALLFQRPYMLRTTARNNIALGLWLGGLRWTDAKRRATQALERVGMTELAGRNAKTLSGGQQQRLALARAWALQPDILFLDEPTASLDPAAKHEVESLVEALGRSGTTVVMSTHNLGQAKRLATHVAYLEVGRLVALASTDHFFNRPLPPAAAAFLRGENPWL